MLVSSLRGRVNSSAIGRWFHHLDTHLFWDPPPCTSLFLVFQLLASLQGPSLQPSNMILFLIFKKQKPGLHHFHSFHSHMLHKASFQLLPQFGYVCATLEFFTIRFLPSPFQNYLIGVTVGN